MKETFTPPSTKTISNLLTADPSGTEKQDVGNESEGGGMLSLASSLLGCCRNSLQRKMTEEWHHISRVLFGHTPEAVVVTDWPINVMDTELPPLPFWPPHTGMVCDAGLEEAASFSSAL